MEAEQRKTPRIGFNTEVTIKNRNGEILAVAQTLNLSPGGLRFSLPVEAEGINENDTVICRFILPSCKEVALLGNIRYIRWGIDQNFKRIKIYGVKFLDLNIDLWSKLKRICNGEDIGLPCDDVISNSFSFFKERKDYRAVVAIPGTIYKNDNQKIICMILDISYGGAKIATISEIKKDENLILEFKFDAATIAVNSKIVWIKRQNSSSHTVYFYGLSFNDLDIEQFEIIRKVVLETSEAAKR